MLYSPLSKKWIDVLKRDFPNRFKHDFKGGEYINLKRLSLSPIDGIDLKKFYHLSRMMRALIFATVEGAQSGHPGGSSSKVEELLTLVLGGVIDFDALNPKHPARDRVVWSAGHCTPALYSLLSIIYESLRREGKEFDAKAINAVFPEDLVGFRHPQGLQGHAESYLPLVDFSTGPSGHGLSAAGGMAVAHRSSGLDTKVWVIMGDAESEEGMTYEARNVLAAVDAKNLIVILDHNHIGLDGQIEEVLTSPYPNHWLGLGWNVVEVDGSDIMELAYAYRLAQKGFDNNNPTVVLASSTKGKFYGTLENTAESHGTAIKHPEYVAAVKKLGFDIPGKQGAVADDIARIMAELSAGDTKYILKRVSGNAERQREEPEAIERMKKALHGRKLVDPLSIKKPKVLPKDLVFEPGTEVATRKAAEAFFKWLMGETAFFWAGAGDVSKSVLTGPAEKVYGIINRQNPHGRGIRFGIAEQNMAMMSIGLTSDVLPGGYRPISVFGSFAVFSTIVGNAVRLGVINNQINPKSKGFFIMLASHDGPETGEDGPTHQGLYWMGLYNALPGIKVYKPTDANETIEMLFYALEKGEPIVLSLTRTPVPVLKRGSGVAKAEDATNGAYIFKSFKGNLKKKVVLAVCGGQVLKNTLKILPDLEKDGIDTKIIVVTSPELFEDYCASNPVEAKNILPEEERKMVVTLHNGWAGFLYPFILRQNYKEKSIGVKKYLKSGTAEECYRLAELAPEDILRRIKSAV